MELLSASLFNYVFAIGGSLILVAGSAWWTFRN